MDRINRILQDQHVFKTCQSCKILFILSNTIYKSSNKLTGSSIRFFTFTKKVTEVAPSIIR